MDIFDAAIICKECNKEMKPIVVEKLGFHLRAVKCEKCGEKIIHPADLERFKHYDNMRGKTYNVKLRVVGNSHAVSIPKEIFDFMNEMHGKMNKDMNDMVRLCFEDFGKLSMNFMGENEYGKE
ncbi:hypothetical protein J4402_00555 [Candidatus Pacearchaeota archaeon]|nr:hypothetical protein [Candidatus Pacearchaeota archaeon]